MNIEAQDFEILTRNAFDKQYNMDDFEYLGVMNGNNATILGYSKKDSLYSIMSSALAYDGFAGEDYVYITKSKALVELWNKKCNYPDIPHPQPYLYKIQNKITSIDTEIKFFEEEFFRLTGFEFKSDSITGDFIDKIDAFIQLELKKAFKKLKFEKRDISDLDFLHIPIFLLQETIRRKINAKRDFQTYRYYGFKPMKVPVLYNDNFNKYRNIIFHNSIASYFLKKVRRPGLPNKTLKDEIIYFIEHSTNYVNVQILSDKNISFDDKWKL